MATRTDDLYIMSQADRTLIWEATPEAFEAILEAFVTTGEENEMLSDQWWTLRDANPASDGMMVEVTRLAKLMG